VHHRTSNVAPDGLGDDRFELVETDGVLAAEDVDVLREKRVRSGEKKRKWKEITALKFKTCSCIEPLSPSWIL
jgi:hypothetical protein